MRLLIVDDEHYIVNYLAALVEAHAPEDLEVYKCYSGMEALELSKTMKIHLALLDIRMPDFPVLRRPHASGHPTRTSASFF